MVDKNPQIKLLTEHLEMLVKLPKDERFYEELKRISRNKSFQAMLKTKACETLEAMADAPNWTVYVQQRMALKIYTAMLNLEAVADMDLQQIIHEKTTNDEDGFV